MLHLEIQRGKVSYYIRFNYCSLLFIFSQMRLSSYLTMSVSQKGMKGVHYQKENGATAACTVRMGGSAISSNPSHKDTLYGDSWFASCATAKLIDEELDCHFVGHVKTAHKRFPKE